MGMISEEREGIKINKTWTMIAIKLSIVGKYAWPGNRVLERGRDENIINPLFTPYISGWKGS
jgi:hypothetical protein